MIRELETDRGDVVMVTAVLIMSLALSVGSSLMVNQGKIEGKEEDMLHVASVSDSMMGLRGSMSALLDNGDTRSTISYCLTLGTHGNPYLAVARSSGSLLYEPGTSSFSMSFGVDEGGVVIPLDKVSGMLTFSASNYYYHDQILMLQGGAIVLDENAGMSIQAAPPFNILNSETGKVLFLEAFGLTGSQWTIAGMEDIPLMVSMKSFSQFDIQLQAGQAFVMSVNGIGERVWGDQLRYVLDSGGMEEGPDYLITEPTDWSDPDQSLTLRMTGIESFNLRTGDMEVTV